MLNYQRVWVVTIDMAYWLTISSWLLSLAVQFNFMTLFGATPEASEKPMVIPRLAVPRPKGAKCWDGLGNFKGLDRTGKIGEIFENTRFESWLWGEHEHILFHRFTLAAGPFVGWFKWTSKATGSRWNPNRVAIELLEQHFSLPVIHGLDIEGIGYGSIPINTIFNGMNIQINQLFWGSAGVPGFWPIPNSESSHSAGLPTRLPQLGLCAGQWKGQRGEQWDWSNNDWGDIWTRK